MDIISIILNKIRSLGSSVIVYKLKQLLLSAPETFYYFKCERFLDSIYRKGKNSIYYPRYLEFSFVRDGLCVPDFTLQIGCSPNSELFKRHSKNRVYGKISLKQLLSKYKDNGQKIVRGGVPNPRKFPPPMYIKKTDE